MEPEPTPQPTTATRQWCRDDFKTPPIKNLRFLVRLDISKQDFEQSANALVDAIQEKGHFDQRGMKAQWDFRLDLQGKAPKPKVLLTHIPLVTRNANAKGPKTVVELHPPIEGNLAQLMIEQDRTDEVVSRYEDLENEIHEWLPCVMEHFKVTRIGGFVLEYRNLIQRDRYPIFWKGEQSLEIGKLLRIFQNNVSHGNFVPPFSVEFNSASPIPGSGNIRFHMEAVHQGNHELCLEVMLAYNSLARKDKRSCVDLFAELAGAHGLLFDDFVRQFSPDALEAFTQ
jgi:hypothetical protein